MESKRQRTVTIAVLLLTFALGLTHFGQVYPDSVGYIDTALAFRGQAQPNPSRLLRPVVPLMASIVASFTDVRTSFALINLFFWCCSTLLMINFSKAITGRLEVGTLAASFFTTSVPMLLYGAAVLTDSASYFFVLIGILVTVIWDVSKITYRRLAIGIALMSIGILSRETVASVFFVVIILAFLFRRSWPKVILFVAIPLVLALLWSLIIGVSYWDWAIANALFAAKHQPLSVPSRILTWLSTINHAFRPEMAILAAVGFVRLKDKSKSIRVVAILLGLSSFLLIAPGVVDYRYTFILFPAVLPLAALGTNDVATFLSRRLPLSSVCRRRFAIGLQVLFLALYVIETNSIAIKYLSLPWKPYVDSSVSGKP